MSQKLTRSALGAATPPVRLVHIGLGSFHRAHQVFYTQQAQDSADWGYCSFTGRSPRMSDALAPQGGVYTLVTRSDDGDTMEHVTALAEVQPAANLGRLIELLADENVAVVTLTITEAAYHLTESGELDTKDSEVAADIEALSAALESSSAPDSLATAAGRLVAGLAARRDQADGSTETAGIAVMSCDNVAGNGIMTRAAVTGTARAVDAELAEWIDRNVTFPSTSIDRITPATTAELKAEVTERTGFRDNAPVVAEPFASWVIAGEFPAGRPAWETAGAEFVDDIELFERRKLWLLNGSHSLMAYFGQLRGHTTVAEAIADATVRRRVEALWDEAARHLTAAELDIPGYRADLVRRFLNPRIRHNLAQIAIDGGTKQRMRAVPIMKAERAAGRDGTAAAFSIAAWIAYLLRGDGAADINDTRAAELDDARRADDPVAALTRVLDEELAGDESALQLIRDLTRDITG